MKYRVLVKCEDFPDYESVIEAPREGLAKTRIMFEYPHALRGQLVEYEVEELGK